MKRLKNEDLKSINGGGFSIGLAIGISAIVSFVSGIISGIANPEPFRK